MQYIKLQHDVAIRGFENAMFKNDRSNKLERYEFA